MASGKHAIEDCCEARAFTQDGATLATAGDDYIIRLWTPRPECSAAHLEENGKLWRQSPLLQTIRRLRP